MQYGLPPQYGAPPQYGLPLQYGPPPAYREWAIVALVLGFFGGVPGIIIGIFAIVQSENVGRRWIAGDAAGALRASRTTKTLCIVNAALLAIGLLSVIGLIFLAVFAHVGLPS
jgi:hypothetical protein